MATFVKMPGTAGNFISTDDVNLLDADRAHVYQSLGGWGNGSGSAVTALVDTRAIIGDKVVEGACITTTGPGTTGVITSHLDPLDGIPALPGQEMTAVTHLFSDVAGWEAVLQLRAWDAAGASLGNAAVSSTTSLGPNPVSVSATGTLPDSTAFVTLYVRYNLAGGQGLDTSGRVRFSGTSLALGTDGTFVPSLRIVGDLDMRARIAADDWTAATNEYILSNRVANTGMVLLALTSNDLFARYGDGATSRGNVGTTGIVFVDGAAYEIRAVFDISAGECLWYVDEVLVDTVTGLSTNAGAPSGETLYVGSIVGGASELFTGDFYWAEVRDGIGGPVVARFDAEDVPVVAQLPSP